jgi:hypothetical protein
MATNLTHGLASPPANLYQVPAYVPHTFALPGIPIVPQYTAATDPPLIVQPIILIMEATCVILIKPTMQLLSCTSTWR